MDTQELQQVLATHFPNAHIHVEGDGRHFDVQVVSAMFEGKTLMQRQRMVYGVVQTEITSGRLHALSLKTYTPTEWKAQVK